MSSYLRRIGYDAEEIPFIPISGLQGDNIIEHSNNLPWYKGPTLLEALDQLKVPKRPTEKPLRIPILNVFKIGGIGTVVQGRVETGVLLPNTKVTIAPYQLEGMVNTI